MGVNDDFKQFQSLFPIDYSPISNFVQYNIINREIYTNWCKAFCPPSLYKKIKTEKINLTENPTDFSGVDKYVLAFGKSVATFSSNPNAYIDFEVHVPIDFGDYVSIGNQYKETIEINAPYDSRFEYSQGDLLIFKLNDMIFKFQVSEEPKTFSGIMYKLKLTYVDKCCVYDLNQTQSEPSRLNKGEYW